MEQLRLVDWVLLIATAVVGAALAGMGRQTGRLARALRAGLQVGAEEHAPVLERLRDELERAQKDQARMQEQLTRCVQKVGMVRYDAFHGSGGKLSFSVALLDGHGNGLVLSVLHGRDGCYAYAKALRDGRPSHPLSEEEQQAVAQAMGG